MAGGIVQARGGKLCPLRDGEVNRVRQVPAWVHMCGKGPQEFNARLA